MLFFCKCLNVNINAGNEGMQNVDKAELGLSREELLEPIFQEKLGIVKPLSITKQQPCLLHMKNTQDWILHKCLNCLMHTHAIRKDSANRTVVINLDLLTESADISNLRTSEKYSSIFKIVVDYSNVSDEVHMPVIKSTITESSDPLQTALTNLQQQLTRTMQQEMQATEQRIRNYQEEQYLQLEEFREKAHNDYNALAGTLMQPSLGGTESSAIVSTSSHQSIKDTPKITLTATISPLGTNSSSTNSSIGISPVRSSEILSSDIDAQSRTSGDTRSPYSLSRPFKSTKSNADCEGLFDLEGMDDIQTPECQENEQADDSDSSNDSDGGLRMNGVRQTIKSDSTEGGIARSLPISVPTYISIHKGGLMDSDSDSMTTDSGMDIAASIKAIAKSVHGDAVFGELPRPRFRTQI